MAELAGILLLLAAIGLGIYWRGRGDSAVAMVAPLRDLEAAIRSDVFRRVRPTRYDDAFGRHGREWRIPPALLKAIAQVESNFRIDAICYNGTRGAGETRHPCQIYQPDRARWDYGIMQIHGRTAMAFGISLAMMDELLVNWDLTISIGARLLDDNRRVADATRRVRGRPPTTVEDWISAYQNGLRSGDVQLPYPNAAYTQNVHRLYTEYLGG